MRARASCGYAFAYAHRRKILRQVDIPAIRLVVTARIYQNDGFSKLFKKATENRSVGDNKAVVLFELTCMKEAEGVNFSIVDVVCCESHCSEGSFRFRNVPFEVVCVNEVDLIAATTSSGARLEAQGRSTHRVQAPVHDLNFLAEDSLHHILEFGKWALGRSEAGHSGRVGLHIIRFLLEISEDYSRINRS